MNTNNSLVPLLNHNSNIHSILKEVQVIFTDKTQVIFNMKNKTVLYINHLKQYFYEDMKLNDFSSFEMTIRVLYAKKILTKL